MHAAVVQRGERVGGVTDYRSTIEIMQNKYTIVESE